MLPATKLSVGEETSPETTPPLAFTGGRTSSLLQALMPHDDASTQLRVRRVAARRFNQSAKVCTARGGYLTKSRTFVLHLIDLHRCERQGCGWSYVRAAPCESSVRCAALLAV